MTVVVLEYFFPFFLCVNNEDVFWSSFLVQHFKIIILFFKTSFQNWTFLTLNHLKLKCIDKKIDDGRNDACSVLR